MRRFLVAAILAALVSVSFAQSQGPSPSASQAQGSGQNKPANDQQTSAANQNPASESPIVTLRILGAKPNAANGAAQHANEGRNNSTDWWMFGATVGIGLIG